MLKDTSNKKLGIVFGILLIIALVIFVSDPGSNERTFRSELVKIDTTSVTQIVIYAKNTEDTPVKLFKEDSSWKVQLENEKNASVPKSKIDNLLSQLIQIKPERLAGRGEASYNDFEVDDSATRVEVYEGSNKTLDLLIGKFTFQQPRTMKSFVRLAEDTDVYEVDGFLSMTFNQDANSYRDQTVINDNVNNWNSLAFSYPADSSYQIVKVDNVWRLSNGTMLDSAKTETALRQLANLRGSEFVDIDEPELPLPEFKLTVIKNNNDQIEVFGYKVADKVIINSSQNPKSYFDGNEGNLFGRVFIGIKKFTN